MFKKLFKTADNMEVQLTCIMYKYTVLTNKKIRRIKNIKQNTSLITSKH